MNALQFIEWALQDIRAIGIGRAVTDEEASRALTRLNSMLAGWAADGLLIPYRTIESLTLTQGTNPHTVGSGGTLNTAQPIEIHDAVVVASGVEYQLRRMGLDEWHAVRDKTVQGIPERYAFEPGLTVGSLYFDWVPSGAYTFRLASLKRFTPFTALTTTDTLPDEYEEAISNNLAVRCGPMYGKEASATTKQLAAISLRKLRNRNSAARVPTLLYPADLRPGGATYNIDSGDWDG